MLNFMRFRRTVGYAALLSLAVSLPVSSQSNLNGPTVDGTPGLFKTWDAETLRPGEVSLSLGTMRTHRDPGQLTITTFPGGMAVGLLNRLEAFGTWETQKHIEAGNIETYRILPGSPSRPATTPLGEQLFSSAAPFMDVPVATGRGELYGRMKYNIFSEKRGQPLSVSMVGVGKAASHKNFTGMNRGLATGDVEVGFGTLVSKRLVNGAQFHSNVLFVWTGHPMIDGISISDLDNSTVVRAGASFPL